MTEVLWQLRVHYEPYTPEEIIKCVTSKAMVMLSVLENDANRPHIHCVITQFNQTKSTFVQQFLKEFPKLNGNGSYSCVKKDDYDAQLRYCCKGVSKETKPVILVCHKDVDWQDCHNRYWQQFDKLKAEGNMGSHQKDTPVKQKSKTWTEKVYDEMKLQNQQDIICIQTFRLLYKPTETEIKEERQCRFNLYHYMKKRLGPKKQSEYILRDMFNGFISGFIQEHKEASEIFNLKEFNNLYPVNL